MSAQLANTDTSPRRRLRWVVVIGVVLALGVLIGANTHLVYVSVASQPECIPHLKPGQTGQGFTAARSSC